jgi:hypothetical protein
VDQGGQARPGAVTSASAESAPPQRSVLRESVVGIAIGLGIAIALWLTIVFTVGGGHHTF